MRSRASENCLTGMRTLQGTHIPNIVILLLILRENLTLQKNEGKDIGHVTDRNFVT